LLKIRPEEDWGKYEFDWKCSSLIPNQKKRSHRTPKKRKNKQEFRFEESSEEHDIYGSNHSSEAAGIYCPSFFTFFYSATAEVPIINTNADVDDGKTIHCPSCTYLNSPYSSKCEMCDSKMN
jgi:hypothetical protein